MNVRLKRALTSSWACAFGTLFVVTWAMLVLRARLDKLHVALLYLLVVLGGSALGSRAVGVSLAGAAFLLFNFLFLPPFNTLIVADPLDWLVLVSFFITSVVAAELLERQRRQQRLAERRRTELDQLSSLGVETLNAARADQALVAIARVIRTSLWVSRCELFSRTETEGLRAVADTGDAATSDSRSAIGQSASADSDDVSDSEELLQYIISSGQAAIAQSDGTVHVVDKGPVTTQERVSALGNVRAYAMPLAVGGMTVGALRISATEPFTLDPERRRMLVTLAYYAALGMDRLRLEQTEIAAEELRRLDRLKDALLAAVSHDLRTPLTTIKAIAHEIAEGGADRAVVIEEEADRMAKLVEGLLELSQLNAGATLTKLELETVDDLVGAAVERSAASLHGHPVQSDIDHGELLIGRFDFGQSLRILTNLLENAAKFSPHGAPIRISAQRVHDTLEISVADRGVGIAPADRARIFEPFYRVPGATADVRGAGLGLSIAKQLAAVQGGALRVSEREGGGTVFTLVLIAGEAPPAS